MRVQRLIHIVTFFLHFGPGFRLFYGGFAFVCLACCFKCAIITIISLGFGKMRSIETGT